MHCRTTLASFSLPPAALRPLARFASVKYVALASTGFCLDFHFDGGARGEARRASNFHIIAVRWHADARRHQLAAVLKRRRCISNGSGAKRPDMASLHNSERMPRAAGRGGLQARRRARRPHAHLFGRSVVLIPRRRNVVCHFRWKSYSRRRRYGAGIYDRRCRRI